MRFALRASEIRTSVRVRLPLRGSEIEGLTPFSDYSPPQLRKALFPCRKQGFLKNYRDLLLCGDNINI